MEIVRRTGPKRKPLPLPEIEPIEYNIREVEKRICIFDTETDPFEPGKAVKPFTCGFYDTEIDVYKDFWGDDCISQFFGWLIQEYTSKGIDAVILVHNGGNFDFYFITEYFDRGHSPFIINGRLVRVMAGGQEFRDSYSMIPVSLGTYDKLEIDYDKLQDWPVSQIWDQKETTCRELFKDEIRAYQKRDCTSLGELVCEWFNMFGDKLTMASVALPKLRSFHGFENLNEHLDGELRPYYFGGRNQCFATGILKGNFKVYDINSSYPNVMRKFAHPISDVPRYEPRITDRTHFAHIRAWSLGALPVRTKSGGLDFPIGTFDFYACIHEIRAGLETGTLKILKTYNTIYFDQESNFADFIDTFYALRMSAKENDDKIRTLFYKLVMNSSYGKFAQDPRKYENWLFDPEEIPTPEYCGKCFDGKGEKGFVQCEDCASGATSPYGWYMHTLHNGRAIYASPQRLRPTSFFNVATAASITSAARAELLRGIQCATRPVYCDTDSVICEHLEGDGIILDSKMLGAWDTEASGDTVAIAGKKMYAVFNEGEVIKKASKGVKLTAQEIVRVANGDVIEYAHPVPKFKLDGTTQFITRKIRAT